MPARNAASATAAAVSKNGPAQLITAATSAKARSSAAASSIEAARVATPRALRSDPRKRRTVASHRDGFEPAPQELRNNEAPRVSGRAIDRNRTFPSPSHAISSLRATDLHGPAGKDRRDRVDG